MNINKKDELGIFGLKAIWPYFKKYKWMFFGMVIMGSVATAIDSIYPLFNRYAINHFVGEKTLDTIGIFLGLYLLAIIIQTVDNYINICFCGKMEMYMDRDLRNAAFDHLQELSFSYYNQNNVGYIHARVLSDSGKIGELVAWKLMDVVWHGSYLIFIAIMMMCLNIKLALMVFLIIPVAAILIAYFEKKLVKLNREVREMNSTITASFNEGITGAKTIKTMVVEDKMIEEFKSQSDKMKRLSVRSAHFSALFASSVTLMSSVALSIVLMRGGRMTLSTALEIGTLSVFMSYALGMIDPLRNLINAISTIIGIKVNIERFCKLMNTRSDVVDDGRIIEIYGDTFEPKKENWDELNGDIEFENVDFRYPDGGEMVLKNFNLKVPKGTNVAIVGETGAGKSTLVNLTCRFFEPTNGRVLIDGRDVRDRSQLWLHSNIGYVLQSPHLFSGTIRENLRYGKLDATDEEIMAALRMVSAEFIVDKMPEGLSSEVGEGGGLLSVGEKQLLSFARAIIADPRILVLDEATSSIDTMTEKLIQEAINIVIKGRTSFVIAHRLSTIVDADLILVVSDGQIVERGTHRELMELKGFYYDLYRRQYDNSVLEAI